MSLTKARGQILDIETLGATFTNGSGPIEILASGQSNAVGRNPTGHFIIDSRVTVWDNENDRDDELNLGSQLVTPNIAANPFVSSNNNLFVHAASRLAQLTRRDVHLYIVAQGATFIDQWITLADVEGVMLTRIKAVLSAASVTSVDMVLWHQGEGSNTEIHAGTYPTYIDLMLANLTSAGLIDASTPFVMGEMSTENSEFMNPALAQMVIDDTRKGLAYISTLETDDGTHFTGESLTRAGLEYIKALSATESDWNHLAGEINYRNRTLLAMDTETEDLKAVPRDDAVPGRQFVVARGTVAESLAQNSDTFIEMTAVAGDPDLIQSGFFRANRAGVWKVSLWCRLTSWGGVQYLRLADVDGAKRIVASKSESNNTGLYETLTGFDINAYGVGDRALLYCEHGKSGGMELTLTDSFNFFLLHAEFLGS